MDERENVNEKVEAALLDKALGGDLRAQMYWLNNRCPRRWSANPEKAPPPDAPVQLIIEEAAGDGDRA